MSATMRRRAMVLMASVVALLAVIGGSTIGSRDASLRNPAGSDPVAWIVDGVERSTIPT